LSPDHDHGYDHDYDNKDAMTGTATSRTATTLTRTGRQEDRRSTRYLLVSGLVRLCVRGERMSGETTNGGRAERRREECTKEGKRRINRIASQDSGLVHDSTPSLTSP
jgi:hypothetical protein